MKRLMLAAILLSAFAIPAAARAACSSTGTSDVFHAEIEGVKLRVRKIGPPLTVGQPPATAVGACDEDTPAPVRGMHLLITDAASNATLCSAWVAETGTYDPFSVGTALGAAIRMTPAEAHPCGVDANWDAQGYALGVAISNYDPARLRFPVDDADAEGRTVGLGIGSVVVGKIWWTDASERVTVEGVDYAGWYARGVGTANWAG